MKLYNFGDIIRQQQWYKVHKATWYKNTIARQYLVKLREECDDFPKPFVHFPLLSSIIDSFDFRGNTDSINVHLRLGDILGLGLGGAIAPVNYDVVNIIKKYDLQSTYNKCRLFFANHNGKYVTESQNKVQELIAELEDFGLQTTWIQGNRPETDFLEMVTCKCFIPSARGFSWLAASCNPNNVYWDVQDPPNFGWADYTFDFQETMKASLRAGYDYHLSIKEKNG
jgi:hypothetical protein